MFYFFAKISWLFFEKYDRIKHIKNKNKKWILK